MSACGLDTPYDQPFFHPEKFECLASEAASTFSMQKSRLIAGRKSVFGMLVAFGLTVVVPSLYAQQNKAGSDSPQAAWSNIQRFVKDMETAVQSKNLHGIHEPSMKIRAPIKTLKQHSSMLGVPEILSNVVYGSRRILVILNS
jgi:hypothetical protein